MRSDWLEAFVVFSERMNFTRAAEALNISQPALHTKIRQLGEMLGVPLYHKQGRTLQLTAAGERLAAFARAQHESTAAFVEELRTGTERQTVVLCAGEGAYLYLLGDAVSQFLSAGRHGLRLLTGDQARCFALLSSGEAHVAVSAPDTVPEGFKATPLTEVGQVLVMPRGHRLASTVSIAPGDLAGEALVVPPQNRPHRTMINRLLMDAGVRWHVAVEAGGWELMQRFVSLGAGLAIVNGCCRLDPGLVARPLPAFPAIHYQVLHREGGPHLSGAVELTDLLLEMRNAWKDGTGGRDAKKERKQP